MTSPLPDGDRHPAPQSAGRGQRWLLFLHQLPSSPSKVRVRTWRRLQQIGALPIGQALYVLPDSPNAREDFEWLKTEIQAAGGRADMFAADSVDAWSDDALIDEFRRSRQQSYDRLARHADQLLKRLTRRSKTGLPRRALQQLKERLTDIEQIDFFGSAGRDRVLTLLQQIEQRTNAGPKMSAAVVASDTPRSYSGRTWVTRPRPGVDRMASAWLIRRFVDANATFGFVSDRQATPEDAIPFDMFGVEFTHRGDRCTFEMLCDTFHLEDRPLLAIGRIVHDLDLKDERFGAPEAPALGLIIEGLRLAHAEDHDLLTAGIALFEALYRALAQTSRVSGPRAVARTRGVAPNAPHVPRGRRRRMRGS